STAINALQAAARSHHFLGISQQGQAAIVTTTGNPDGHLVLRGGKGGPNFHAEAVQDAARRLAAEGLPARLMVDCSHGNSNKDYRRQGEVLRSVADQVRDGSTQVMGVMLESHLVAGQQKIPADLSQLTYGQSVTDACIDLATTLELLDELAAAVREVRDRRLVHA
ncbi:MAG: 3-deoxy-7-phosphoheptulonate synthase, partial [Cyanobium sp.]